MKHKTTDGRVIDISEMSDSHLINTCKLLRRRAKEGFTVQWGGISIDCDEPWYDTEEVFGKTALRAMNYYEYEKELKKRGLSIPKD